MSDLQKSFAKAKLAKLSPEAPPILDDPGAGAGAGAPSSSSMYSLEEEASHDGDDSSSASSTGTAVPSPTRQLFARPNRGCVFCFSPNILIS